MDRRQALHRAALLGGSSLSISLMTSLITGCREVSSLTWQPTFHSKEEAKALTVIADIILPNSNSPSASEVSVPAFLDLLANECMTAEEQRLWRDGLTFLLESHEYDHANTFLQADRASQVDYIIKRDQEAYSGGTDLMNAHFRMLKNLVLTGYFTSEKVMTTYLDHHPIPGRYDGCVPYQGQGIYVDNNVEGRLIEVASES